MKKNILVTGGAGYIGAHTVFELTEAGFEPIIVDNFSRSDRTLLDGLKALTGKDLIFHEGDCADKSFLDRIFSANPNIAAVIHFAAFKAVGESVSEPLLYYHNNINSMLSLLEVMRTHGVKDIIFSSSCTVYGQPKTIPVDENAEWRNAESPYGATKQMCERILADSVKIGYRVISLRYFNPIGAHPSSLLGELPIGSPNNLVPYITQTAAGVRPKLTIFGGDYATPDGTCIRDFIHVVDLAKAHVKALEFLLSQTGDSCFEAFNVGTGIGYSVLQVVKDFLSVTHAKLNFEIGPRRPGDVEKIYADPSKCMEKLNWKPLYSIHDALMHAWSWEKKIRSID